MKTVLVLYASLRGHTARVARHLCRGIESAGARAEMMDVTEAVHEGVDWSRYDAFVLGAPVIYGTYDAGFLDFVRRHATELASKPNAFFNVSVVARTPEKATPEGNRYLQKFLQVSPWRPQHVKCFAGKVDYPAWPWYAVLMIQLIMKYTDGPTDRHAVIDYTDWADVDAYGRWLATLAAGATTTPG